MQEELARLVGHALHAPAPGRRTVRESQRAPQLGLELRLARRARLELGVPNS